MQEYQHVVKLPDVIEDKVLEGNWSDVDHYEFAKFVEAKEAKLSISYSDRLVAEWEEGNLRVRITGPKYDKKLLDRRNVDALHSLSRRLGKDDTSEQHTTELDALGVTE